VHLFVLPKFQRNVIHGMKNTKSQSICMRFEDLRVPSVYIFLCGRKSLESASPKGATSHALG
jgi:hypothetical protein